jgi:peptidoglycan-associated lipoprotein
MVSKNSAKLLATSLALTIVIIVAPGCAKKHMEDEGSSPNGPETSSAMDNSMGDSDSGKALGMQTVHYPYDSSNLDDDAKKTLKANAAIMKEHSDLKIQIEGHCDRHGGIQYNIALGEKRANAAKKYLEDIGVNSERVSTISFGKEHLLDSAETEAADAKNRRANFVITSK